MKILDNIRNLLSLFKYPSKQTHFSNLSFEPPFESHSFQKQQRHSTTVASALAALDAALAHRQRSLGGSATLSTTATELVERGVVDALLCALALPALGESERLQALRVVAMLARQSERAAQRLAAAQHAPMLAQLFAGRVSVCLRYCSFHFVQFFEIRLCLPNCCCDAKDWRRRRRVACRRCADRGAERSGCARNAARRSRVCVSARQCAREACRASARVDESRRECGGGASRAAHRRRRRCARRCIGIAGALRISSGFLR